MTVLSPNIPVVDEMVIRACTTIAASNLSTSTPILGVCGLTRYKKMIHWLKSNASRWRCIYAPVIIYCTARARHASLSGERMCLLPMLSRRFPSSEVRTL